MHRNNINTHRAVTPTRAPITRATLTQALNETDNSPATTPNKNDKGVPTTPSGLHKITKDDDDTSSLNSEALVPDNPMYSKDNPNHITEGLSGAIETVFGGADDDLGGGK